jgi:hypothetical protein
LQPLSPPRPLNATLTLATGTLVVDFDKLLETAPLTGSNWFAWDGVNRHDNLAGVGSALMRRVTMPLPALAPDFSPVRCTYLAAIPDLIGTNGLAVAPFLGFPLTVV